MLSAELQKFWTDLNPKLSGVWVIGDAMLDQFWQGACTRISPEAPVPVVGVNQIHAQPGGAANVAMNLAALGMPVQLWAAIGTDSTGLELTELLSQQNIRLGWSSSDQVKTITKLRILSQQQQLLRIDQEKKTALPAAWFKLFQSALVAACESGCPPSLLILSDYQKGVLANPQQFIKLAQAFKIPVIVDPKHHNFSVYRHANLLKPNLAEFEVAIGRPIQNELDLMASGKALRIRLNIETLLITAGSKGIYVFTANHEKHCGTTVQEVFDVTGAGDTVTAVIAIAMSLGLHLDTAIQLANIAGGLVVQKLGTVTVTRLELLQAYRRWLYQTAEISDDPIISENQLDLILEQVRHRQEKIVVTNGCFDILHAGHIQYLSEARKLGHRLLVLLNTDESIRLQAKNKNRQPGEPQRPINHLADRLSVLAGLKAVDWVLPFSDKTPERLIEKIKPDWYVKGGDYEESRFNQFPEVRFVRANGGQAKLLGYRTGCSTSQIVQSIFLSNHF